MKIGYARVSRRDQNLNLQIDALKGVGCEKIFTDKISGAVDKREGLGELLAFARPGDQIVVWKLDRLARTMKHLIALVNDLADKNIHLYVIQGGIDTTTPTGKVMYHMFSVFAEMERDFIRERTVAGLEAARARGRSGGRPMALEEEKAKGFADLVRKSPEKPVAYWCETFGISRSTYYRQIKPLL